MNSHQLECFIQVAETLSFARAAEIMNMSQPSVSRQIHSLEEELGVPLFQRTTRSVTLTPYGSQFLIDARQIFRHMAVASLRMRQKDQPQISLLSIGCCMGYDLDFFTNLLQKTKSEIPDLHPYLRIIPHKHIINLFMENQIDAVLGFKEDIYEKSDVKYLHLFYVDICCVVAASHPFAQRTSIPVEALFSENMVICNTPDLPLSVSQLQKQLESHFMLSSSYYCDDVPVALSMVRAGYGFAVLPDLQSDMYSDVACIPIETMEPLSYGLYYKKSSTENPALQQFISMLR
jgi:DNA-binding transcriptional LysR family regulator